MTIQKTALLSLATLLLASSANAQSCSRTRPVVIHLPQRHHHHDVHYVAPQRTYQTVHHVTAHVLETPPTPDSIAFGGWSHTDELAASLEVLMNELCLDLYYNYSHNHGFRETYGEAFSLFKTVQYIHAAEHNYDRATVQTRLGGADALFHHIQENVHGWSRIQHRQIGTLGIVTKMHLIERTLHQLMDDVGVSASTGLEVPPTPQALSVPQQLSYAPEPPALP